MNRIILLILIIISLSTDSCSSRKNKLNHRNLIPEKEFISLLTEIHIADGLLSHPEVSTWYPEFDTISTFYYISGKHGYSKETMDRTLKYYYVKKPKKLIEIYDKILGNLSEMESISDKELALAAGKTINLWKTNDFFCFPNKEKTDSGKFDIILKNKGFYIISFSATIFPDDQSVNPRMTAFTCHPDSIETGKRKYLNTLNYIKDGVPHIYSYSIKVPSRTTLHLRGWLYDCDNHLNDWEKHMSIENISLTFTTVFE